MGEKLYRKIVETLKWLSLLGIILFRLLVLGVFSGFVMIV